MRPAIVSGIVNRNALSLVTVPEVFAKVSSIQFSSRSQVANWDLVSHYFWELTEFKKARIQHLCCLVIKINLRSVMKSKLELPGK